jgi:hypothetical protein
MTASTKGGLLMTHAEKLDRGEARRALTYDNPAYPIEDWDNGSWSVQNWFERTAWKTLHNTQYGRPADESEPHPALWEDPLLRQIYLLDLATFVTAEYTSILAVSGMVKLAPDEVSQLHLSTQVLDEARHYEVFCRRLADFGVTPERRKELTQRVTTPAMQRFYDLILEQVDKGDFIATSLAQNITLEGMAYPIYRYEIKYWSRFDPSLSQVIRGAFADEAHHVGYGEAIMRGHLGRLGSDARNRAIRLIHDFETLMTEVFEGMINHYIGLYQEAANNHLDIIGDLEIFPGRIMANITEEEQVRLLLSEIQREHGRRLGRIGI